MFGKKCLGDCSKCNICETELQSMHKYNYTEEDLIAHKKEKLEFEKNWKKIKSHKISLFFAFMVAFIYYIGKYIAPTFFIFGCIYIFVISDLSLLNFANTYSFFTFPTLFFFFAYLLIDKYKLLE